MSCERNLKETLLPPHWLEFDSNSTSQKATSPQDFSQILSKGNQQLFLGFLRGNSLVEVVPSSLGSGRVIKKKRFITCSSCWELITLLGAHNLQEVFKADRLLYHSTLGLRVIQKKRRTCRKSRFGRHLSSERKRVALPVACCEPPNRLCAAPSLTKGASERRGNNL